MIITTTQSIEGQTIHEYKGIVVCEAIMGANIVRDFVASITNVIGGRSGAYKHKLADARQIAEANLIRFRFMLGMNCATTYVPSKARKKENPHVGN